MAVATQRLSGTFAADPTHSSFPFAVKHMKVSTFRAGFGDHPEIIFRSSRVVLGEDGGARVGGELEIKGIARPVTATGRYQPPVPDPFGSVRAALELSATVDRRNWGMNWQMPLPGGGDVLGYDVELTAHLELVREE